MSTALFNSTSSTSTSERSFLAMTMTHARKDTLFDKTYVSIAVYITKNFNQCL